MVPGRNLLVKLSGHWPAVRTLTAIVLGLAPVAAQAQILTGTVSVIDGDTLDMGGAHIRLFGIDAPESDQTCRRNG